MTGEFLTVRPADDVSGSQVFRSQPVFERPEVLSERRRVQFVVPYSFSKRLLPRYRRASLHNFPATTERDKGFSFPWSGTRENRGRRIATQHAGRKHRPLKLPWAKLVIRALLGFNEITGGAFSTKRLRQRAEQRNNEKPFGEENSRGELEREKNKDA